MVMLSSSETFYYRDREKLLLYLDKKYLQEPCWVQLCYHQRIQVKRLK